MPWKVFTTMPASILYQFYKIGTIMILFPDFACSTVVCQPKKHSPKAKKGNGTREVTYRTWNARAGHCPKLCCLWSASTLLHPCIVQENFLLSSGLRAPHRVISVSFWGYFSFLFLLSAFWSRWVDISLYSTWGKRRRTGWNKALSPHAQGKGWCSWRLPWSSKHISSSSNNKMVSWLLAVLLSLLHGFGPSPFNHP